MRLSIIISMLAACSGGIFAHTLPETGTINSNNVSTVIHMQIPDDTIDSAELIIHSPKHMLQESIYEEKGLRVRKKVSDNHCSISVPELKNLSYYSIRFLNKKDNKWADREIRNLIAPGDSVHILFRGKIYRDSSLFSGRGALKMRWLNNLDKASFPFKWDIYSTLPDHNTQNIWLNRELKNILLTNRICSLLIDSIGKLPVHGQEKELLILETLGYYQKSCVQNISIEATINRRYTSKEVDTIMRQLSISTILPGEIDQLTRGMSNTWANYILHQVSLNRRFLNDTTETYYLLKKYPAGLLRDKVMLMYFYSIKKASNNISSQLADALLSLSTPAYRPAMEKQQHMHSQGKAFNFSLEDTTGKRVQLESLKGKVVFLDFWFPGCMPCAMYYKRSVAPAKKYFSNNAAVVFVSICIKGEREKWLDAIRSGLYTSSETTNLYTGTTGWDHEVVKRYGVIGAPKPFLIDANGNFYSTDSYDLGRQEPDKLIQTIKACLREATTHQ